MQHEEKHTTKYTVKEFERRLEIKIRIILSTRAGNGKIEKDSNYMFKVGILVHNLSYKTEKWSPLCDIKYKSSEVAVQRCYIIITSGVDIVKLGNECFQFH